MRFLISFVVLVVAGSSCAQYPSADHEEEVFQSPEPISGFARLGSRPVRGYGGAAPVEVLPDQGYQNKETTEQLPNYGGGFREPAAQILPVKQEAYPIKEETGYGPVVPLAPLQQNPTYGAPVVVAPIQEVGYGSAPLKTPGYRAPAGPAPGYGATSSAVHKHEPYLQPQQPLKAPGGYGGGSAGPVGSPAGFGDGHRKPQSLGYNSGAGISFGHGGHHGGWGASQPAKQPIHVAPGGGYGGGAAIKPQQSFTHTAPGGHSSYSKPPVVQPGYGQPLTPPKLQGPVGYGR